LGDTYLKTYIGGLAAFAAILAASWSYWYGLTFEPPLVVGAILFACFILAGELFSMPLSKHATIGVSNIPIIIAVAAMGPTWAALAVLPAALFVGRRDALRTLYEIGHSVTIVYLAGIVFSFASQPLLLDKTASLATILYGTLVLGATQMVASEVIGGTLVKVKYNQAFHETWQEVIQPYLLPECTRRTSPAR
jgi:uncharacterized membrane protein